MRTAVVWPPDKYSSGLFINLLLEAKRIVERDFVNGARVSVG